MVNNKYSSPSEKQAPTREKRVNKGFSVHVSSDHSTEASLTLNSADTILVFYLGKGFVCCVAGYFFNKLAVTLIPVLLVYFGTK